MSETTFDITAKILASRILIVDDSEVNRMFLEAALKKHGFHNLLHAENGKEALEMFRNFSPDLILLDLVMPEMDGFAVCETIRRMPEAKSLPILVQTALTKQEERLKAFTSGATDFVTKPLFPEELIARVNVHLENVHFLRDLQFYKDRVEAELSAARELQYSILPQGTDIRVIEDSCDLEIASYFEPSSEIGGDFWGIKRLGSGQVAFWAVDFSGHSVAAALNVFRLQAYIEDDFVIAAKPGPYMSMLNEKLLNLLSRGQFATMFYGVIDNQENRLTYASAGSPHPILLRRGGEKSSIINATGRPLGISAHCYVTQSIEFLPGDAIFFYSDALIETSSSQGKYIDERSLLSWLREIDSDPEAMMKEMLTRFNRHTDSSIRDDLTMVFIRRAGEQQRKRLYA